jgi:hypothetical protein
MTRKGSDYVHAPEIPPGYLARYEVTMQAMYGAIDVTEAARRLKISRVRFQTLMHRAQRAFAAALVPQPAGRPAKPAREVQLEAQLTRLERENALLREQVETAKRLLGAAGQLLKSVGRRRGGRIRVTASPATKGTNEPEDPDPDRPTTSPRSRRRWPRLSRAIWKETIEMRGRWPAHRGLAAALLGVTSSTVRRWKAADLIAPPLPYVRAVVPTAAALAIVEAHVRASHGLIGADGLRRLAPSTSRRAASAIKAQTLTAMECERKTAAGSVRVVQPGALRGFDAMYVATTEGWRYLLVCADAAVPYRTTIDVVEHYDGVAVAATLSRDMDAHGVPLAYRLDRAACHAVDDVLDLLHARGALVLHGPPHHPRYYGQLERQNREHRAWLEVLGLLTPVELVRSVRRMQHALNALWPRRTLSWQTSEAVWMQRQVIVEDRSALRAEVAARAARIRSTSDLSGRPADTAERFAIEHAFRLRGYLNVQTGARC